MTDIRSMYLQCQVTTDDQHSLKFLWYRDGDPKWEIVDLDMTSQAFGITSLGGNARYLLQRMALDNCTNASKLTSNTICWNVYVEDITKS